MDEFTTPILGQSTASAGTPSGVLGQAPADTGGRLLGGSPFDLDYMTFGALSGIRRGLERVGSAAMGLDAAPAPTMQPAGGIGLGILPVSQLPGSYSGVGAQYAPPTPPAVAPVAPPAPSVAPVPSAARNAAPAGSGGVPDSYFGVDLRPAKAAAAGLAGVSEIGRLQMQGLGAEEKALKGTEARTAAEAETAQANLAKVQEAERAAAAERESLTASQADAARVAEEDAAIERETRRQAAQDAAAKLEAAQKTLDETKIDVDKAYGGAAGRIFAGIAVALGSFGASLTGGPNYAMQIVDKRIDREIDAQRSELDKAKGKVSELGRLLQRNEDLLGDATKAKSLARAQTYTALAANLEARKAGGELAGRQAQIAAELRAKAADEMDKIAVGIRETGLKAQMIPALEREAKRKLAAGFAAAERKEKSDIRKAAILESIKQGQLTLDPATGALVAGTGTTEQQEKLIGRTTALVKTLDEKNLLTGPEGMVNLMQLVGVDPVTGEKRSTGSVAGYSFGGKVRDPFVVTSQAKEIRRQVGEQVEAVAKSSGGVITDGDRAGALTRINGSGTVEELQNALVDFYGKYASKARSFAAADPQAFTVVAKANPALAAVVNFGQAKQAATAAGFRAGAK